MLYLFSFDFGIYIIWLYIRFELYVFISEVISYFKIKLIEFYSIEIKGFNYMFSLLIIKLVIIVKKLCLYF